MSEDLQSQRYYVLERISELREQIPQTMQAMVVFRARIEKYRQTDLSAAHDTYDALRRIRRHPFADDCRRAFFNRYGDIVVSVALRARNGEEAVARFHGARIVDQPANGGGSIAAHLPDGGIFQNIG